MTVCRERRLPIAVLLLRNAERGCHACVVRLGRGELAVDGDGPGGAPAHGVERGEIVGGERIAGIAGEAMFHPRALEQHAMPARQSPEDGLRHDAAAKESSFRCDVDVRVGEKARMGCNELGQRSGVRILRLMRAHAQERIAGVGVDQPEPDTARRELMGEARKQRQVSVGNRTIGGDEDGRDISGAGCRERCHFVAVDVASEDERLVRQDARCCEERAEPGDDEANRLTAVDARRGQRLEQHERVAAPCSASARGLSRSSPSAIASILQKPRACRA
ncbi:MAG TPA: hypothetical protein VE218_11415 [Acidobacteriaceae bacterium]|nr:hypothetical protein [Acidobacteriaceae bacterium]